MKLFSLKIFRGDAKFDFLKIKNFSYLVSLVLCGLSILALIFLSLNLGIDFKGGVTINIRSKSSLDILEVRRSLSELDVGELVIQEFAGSNEVSIKFSLKQGNLNVSKIVDELKDKLSGMKNSDIEYRKVDFVGPQVGSELIRSSLTAVCLSFIAIMVYMWFRFEWQFSLGVLISLLHDVILSLGFMSVTGLDFNLASVAGILTIIGYSVNDSVVIYDRIRENLRKYKNVKISSIINNSINETLSRTVLTVLTTLIANLSLILFAGEAIRSFGTLVFFGIVIGTYSSIFISAPILTFFNIEKFK